MNIKLKKKKLKDYTLKIFRKEAKSLCSLMALLSFLSEENQGSNSPYFV